MTISLDASDLLPGDGDRARRPHRLPANAAAPNIPRPVDLRFEIRTVSCDGLRAMVRLVGSIAEDAAGVLAQVLDDHQRAGRRFLRLDLHDVRTICPAALAVVHRAHDALLARRGTLILTGVDSRVAAMLYRGDPDGRLFVLPPTADDLVSIAG